MAKRGIFVLLAWLAVGESVLAGIGDPQVATDHPWYPGELAVSTFERLAATQAAQYERAVGRAPQSDEEKALAAWYWRNTHFYHGEEGHSDLLGRPYADAANNTREYWTGLFAHGYALCGTTHAQWTAEMEHLLGHATGRCVGVAGHNSFEVFLTGGPYGAGKWVLLDHDLSTVIFDREGKSLLSIPEIKADLKQLTRQDFSPARQQGWLVSGLHEDDAPGVYSEYATAEYLAGYAGPPPLVHLRRGETLVRFLQPGLVDGRTFVFWGRNYGRGVPGPERGRTWVNQPEKMHGAKSSTPDRQGQARYGNALYIYEPNFASGEYREGVVSENDKQVTFSFRTPYVIGATPPNDKSWGIYDAGCKNGLVVTGKAACTVAVSLDAGRTWKEGGQLTSNLDMTDLVKGSQQYWLRFAAGAKELAQSGGVRINTVCAANPAVLPQLTSGGSTVRFDASGQAIVSAGPNLAHAQSHVAEGAFGSPRVTLELTTPHQERVTAIVAAAHVASSNPPRAEMKYQIEYSIDGGKSWLPVVRDWNIPRRGHEPGDFWSQSFCYGSLTLPADSQSHTVRVRFRNDGGKNYLRAEAHLVYALPAADATRVTFAWSDSTNLDQRAEHVFEPGAATEWKIPTGRDVRTRFVIFEPVAKR